MPNPAGRNQFRTEPPQGAKKVVEDLQKSAIMAGQQGASSAINTPDRSKDRAVRGKAGKQPVRAGQQPLVPQAPAAAAPVVELPYPDRVAAVWTEISMHPEASELVQRYAQRAQEQAASGGAST